MSLLGDLNGVDINNPTNLEMYSEVLIFKNDPGRNEVLFFQRSNAEQVALQAIAHNMSLHCEYSTITGFVRICRPISSHTPLLDVSQTGAFWNEILGNHDSHIVASAPSNLTPPSSGHTADIFSVIEGVMDLSWPGENKPGPGTMYPGHPADQAHQQERAFSQEIMDMTWLSESQAGLDVMSGANQIHRPQNNDRQENRLPSQEDLGSLWPDRHNDGFDGLPELNPTFPLQHHHIQIQEEGALSFEGDDTNDSLEELQDPPSSLMDYSFPSGQAHHNRFESRSTSGMTQTSPGEALLAAIRSSNYSARSPAQDLSASLPQSASPNHLELESYRCDLCPRTYFKAEAISRHRKFEHPSTKVKYYCSSCTRSFDQRLHLNRHRILCKMDNGSAKGRRTRTKTNDSVYSSSSAGGYSEIMFDSSSAHSTESFASAKSRTSIVSSRRGPLNDLARAGMQALKKIGACWRCKILKKSCDEYSPCALCPRTGTTDWKGIGCNRGNFKHPHANFCIPGYPLLDSKVIEAKISSLNATMDDTKTMLQLQIDGPLQASNQALQELDQRLNTALISELSETASAQLIPLKLCTVTIVWIFSTCPGIRRTLNEEGSLVELRRLLIHAILYQAEQQDNQLIAQSLICLRTCAEVLRAKASGVLTPILHSLCAPRTCKYDCVANLNIHLHLYTEELSRVVFKKENLRDRVPWWLSAFYSFCIQSYVRRALIALTTNANTEVVTNAPRQLEVAYSLFHDNARLNPNAAENALDMASATWQASTYMRRWWLRKALSMNQEQLDTMRKSVITSNPLKCSRVRFDHFLELSKFSRETFPEEFSRNPTTEAEQYLYLPLRLFCTMIPTDLMDHDAAVSLESRLSKNHIDGARLAVNYSSWHNKHILSPQHYVKHLFEDDGGTIQEESLGNSENTPHAKLGSKCTVCSTDIQPDSDVATLPCSHWFHGTCVVAWLEETNTCPTCDDWVYAYGEVGEIS